MDMKIFKHVPKSLRYWKINLDHYTYIRKNGDIPPPNHNFTSFLRSKKTSLANFEHKFLIVQEESTVKIWWGSSYIGYPRVRICKNSLDLLQFPNFRMYPMLWQFWKKTKQRTLGLKSHARSFYNTHPFPFFSDKCMLGSIKFWESLLSLIPK
jgi:hypothetical protein